MLITNLSINYTINDEGDQEIASASAYIQVGNYPSQLNGQWTITPTDGLTAGMKGTDIKALFVKSISNVANTAPVAPTPAPNASATTPNASATTQA